jgi:cytochrome c oxidase cbb3-type subunit I/II
MLDPTITSPGSIMPAYPWLIEQNLDKSNTPAKIRAMQILGVPYPAGFDQEAIAHLENQANEIVKDLKLNQIEVTADKEIIAMIAYLQRLGTDIKVK